MPYRNTGYSTPIPQGDVSASTEYEVAQTSIDIATAPLAVGTWENETAQVATLLASVEMSSLVAVPAYYTVELQLDDGAGGAFTTIDTWGESKAVTVTVKDFNILLGQVKVAVGQKVQMLIQSDGADTSVDILTTWTNNK